MKLLPTASIIVPTSRVRPVLPENVAALADSIEKLGLLQPLVLEGDILRAGEHRLKALELLWSQGIPIIFEGTPLLNQVPCIDVGELSPLRRLEIEIEENLIRTQMTWQERASAFAKLHSMKAVTASSPKEAVRETLATIQGVPASEVVSGLIDAHQTILIGNSLSDPDIAKAKTQAEALKILTRKIRKEADTKAGQVETADLDFVNSDAILFLRTLPDASIDCLVTDPPYGIGIEQMSFQNSSEQKYDDSYETWLGLMAAFLPELSRVLKPNADGYIFCDFTRFKDLATFLTGEKFEVYPRPFIWNRFPDGRLTTPEKWPRRVYECILYFRRGSRPLFETRADVLSVPADRMEDNYHGAKKPEALFRDLIERSTRVGDCILDPFAGSGPAIRAAKALNRRFKACEGDPAYFALAKRLMEKNP